ncbi:MAG TPA: DUF3631 domain-containing protein [Acidiphilium sp.]|nr:DUF3631 domain-containing protein [Acidiphilium sp.]
MNKQPRRADLRAAKAMMGETVMTDPAPIASATDTPELSISDHAIPAETAQKAIERLAKLTAIEYDQSRTAEADALGIRVTTLDDEVRKARGEGAEPTHGRRLSFKTHEPWADPVNLADVLDELAAAIDRHVILATAARDATALWIAHTWVYSRFQYSPRLAITSPEKRCGKSTLLDILRATCLSPIKADNISASSVFRTIEALSPLTLLIDEADTHLRENAEELRGVLNSGFEASGNVIRVVEIQGEHQPVQFATFAPVALAAIKCLPGTLEDRAIPIRLERKTVDQTVDKMRDGGARAAIAIIGRKLARWGRDAVNKLDENPAIPSALNDREGDISVPILSIADAAGPVWAGRGRRALQTLFGDRSNDDEAAGTGAMLLADIRQVFTDTSSMRMTTAELAEKLGAMEDRPWPEWRQSKPITPTQLSRALAPFRIRSENMKIAGTAQVRKGYQRDHFADAWTRYLPSDPPSPPANPLPATIGHFTGELSKNGNATDPLPSESSGATGGSVADAKSDGSGSVADGKSATMAEKYSKVAGSGLIRGDGEREAHAKGGWI